MSNRIRNLIMYGIASLTLCAAIGFSALAQSETETSAETPANEPVAPPTEITSDSMEYDMKNQLARLVGNVLVRDKDMTLQADQMELYFSQENEVQRIEASGAVVITRGAEKAVSGKAIYDVAKGIITLTDKPVLFRGPSRIRNAAQITFDREGGKAKALPAEGEQLVIEFYHETDEDAKGLEILRGSGEKEAPKTP